MSKFITVKLCPTIDMVYLESCAELNNLEKNYPEYFFVQIIYFPEEHKIHECRYDSYTGNTRTEEKTVVIQQPYALLKLK